MIREMGLRERTDQRGRAWRDLLVDIPSLIEWASSFYSLMPGDVILTGTPEGVGPIHDGDTIHASIEKIGDMRVHVRLA